MNQKVKREKVKMKGENVEEDDDCRKCTFVEV